MAANRTSIHGQWSSRWAFILAATGSAVGLGNIWRFPYLTGENGGGIFVMVYLVCVVLVGIPILMAEVMLGRRGRQSPINTMKSLAEDENQSKGWQLIGWMGMLTGFLIVSFYSVIAGWTLAYIVRTANGVFIGAGAEQMQPRQRPLDAVLDQIIRGPWVALKRPGVSSQSRQFRGDFVPLIHGETQPPSRELTNAGYCSYFP